MIRVGEGLGHWIVMVLLLGFITSCAPPRQPKTTTSEGTNPEKAGLVPVQAAKANSLLNAEPTSPKTSKEYAQKFLESLANGIADSDMLTTEFKKEIARPITEEDRKVGYSDLTANLWLNSLGKTMYSFANQVDYPIADQDCFHGDFKADNKVGTYSLRLCKQSSGGYRVCWFQRSFVKCEQAPKADGEAKIALEYGKQFVETVLSNELTLAEALLMNSTKQDLAPALPSDKAPYNQKFLHTILKRDGQGYNAYKILAADSTGNNTYTLRGELLAAEKTQPCKIVVRKDKQSGLWLVESFQFH